MGANVVLLCWVGGWLLKSKVRIKTTHPRERTKRWCEASREAAREVLLACALVHSALRFPKPKRIGYIYIFVSAAR